MNRVRTERELVSLSRWASFKSLPTVNSNVVKLSVKTDVREMPHVCHTNCLWSPGRWYPELVVLWLFFQHSLVSSQTGIVLPFAVPSWMTVVTCPSKNPLLVFEQQIKFANPVDLFSVSSPCTNEKVKSPEEDTVGSVDKMRSQLVPEVLNSVLSSKSEEWPVLCSVSMEPVL